MQPDRSRASRWIGGGLLVLLLSGLVYRPHRLHGHPPPPAFPPRRIVSLNLAADEILLALTPPERIAALTSLADDPRFSNVATAARRIPHRVHSNAEHVIALQPDLVIVSAFTSAAVKTPLRDAGVLLLELSRFTSFTEIARNILAVGRATGDAEAAQALVAEMERRIGAVRQRVLYYTAGAFTAGSGTTMDEIITAAGGSNAATEAGIHGWKQIAHEAIVVLDPAVVLVSGDSALRGLQESLLADPTLQDIAAVRHRRVYTVPRSYTSTVSHHIVRCVEAVAQVLHPDLFPAATVHG